MDTRDFFSYKNWAVAGDVLNECKYAHKIVQKLIRRGYNVVGINPRMTDVGPTDIQIFKDIKETNGVEVLDLCINPVSGMEIVKSAKEAGIKNILIQPGAESQDIIDYCISNGINVIRGCVLVSLSDS